MNIFWKHLTQKINRSFNSAAFFLLLFLMISGTLSCSSLRRDYLRDQKPPPSYSWSNFFNYECGPVVKVIKDGNSHLTLLYPCANGAEITQAANFHVIENGVELWAAHRLSTEQLYQVSTSKCQASIIYLGSDHATMKYPCALVHLTVGYDIIGMNTIGGLTEIYLQPNKVLITYGNGLQEFKVEGDDLIPLTPFHPFKAPTPFLAKTLIE